MADVNRGRRRGNSDAWGEREFIFPPACAPVPLNSLFPFPFLMLATQAIKTAGQRQL